MIITIVSMIVIINNDDDDDDDDAAAAAAADDDGDGDDDVDATHNTLLFLCTFLIETRNPPTYYQPVWRIVSVCVSEKNTDSLKTA